MDSRMHAPWAGKDTPKNDDALSAGNAQGTKGQHQHPNFEGQAAAQQSAPDAGASIVPGTFPPRKDTVTAEVLARLLSGERLTGLEAVSEASTTRLAAVVHYLLTEYRWPIEKADKAAGCRDGRVAWVAEYSMHRDAIAGAMKAGAGSWCSEVRTARRSLRKEAPRARSAAARFNAVPRRCRPMWKQPQQGSLFDGGAL